VAVASLGGALLAAHNKAVTGSATRLAYAHYEATAPGAPPFFWQPLNAPTERLRVNELLRLDIDVGSYRGIREDWRGAMWARAAGHSLPYYFPHAAFALVFLLVPFALRQRGLWLLIASAAAVGVAVGMSSFFLPHYIGPAVPPLLVMYALGCGVLTRLRLGTHRLGRAIIAAFSLALAALGVWRLVERAPLEQAMTQPTHWTRQRDAIARHLTAMPGQHLIFVRYDSSYRSQNEWVQNGADLTRSTLLWVHQRANSGV
jgi:hypothetical protein